MANTRTLGLQGKQRQTKKPQVIRATQIDVIGVIGKFQRQYAVSFPITKNGQIAEIFGEQLSSHFGHDIVQGIYDQTQCTTYVKSHIGNTGSAIDAVVASSIIKDQAGSPVNTLKIEFAYQGNLCYGAYGGRFGRKIIAGNRYDTALSATIAAADTQATVDAIGDIKVGDIVEFDVTGGPVYKKITEIDEANSVIKWSGAFHATLTGAINDAVNVIGFQVKKYFKDRNGVESEIESELGKVYCTLEPEVSDYYVENVHKDSGYFKITDQASASSLNLAYPASDANIIYLGSVTANGDVAGADGTSPSTSAHWAYNHSALDNNPVTIIVNGDTTDSAYFNTLENYCKNRTRTDFPICLPTITKGLSKASLQTTGRAYQSSSAKLMVNVGTWLKKKDQFATSSLAPDREIPNVGHVAGAWIYTVQNFGIHEVPAFDLITLKGITGVVNDVEYSDTERTELADAGMNVITKKEGVGVQIRNFFTASTATEYRHGNSLIMLKYVRESVKESVRGEENRPNVLGRIASTNTAIFRFMYNLWSVGSTGRVPLGETFGQFFNDDNTPSVFDQHVEIIADASNNPKDQLLLGDRNYEIGFSVPTPNGSIFIYAGLVVS
jgi:hypothetical protein